MELNEAAVELKVPFSSMEMEELTKLYKFKNMYSYQYLVDSCLPSCVVGADTADKFMLDAV
jgi:hypothetical protein